MERERCLRLAADFNRFARNVADPACREELFEVAREWLIVAMQEEATEKRNEAAAWR
jgi:hypothetical protein